MTHPVLRLLWPMLLLALTAPARAQVDEPLVRWPHYKEIALPAGNESGGLFDFVLDVQALRKSRTDHAEQLKVIGVCILTLILPAMNKQTKKILLAQKQLSQKALLQHVSRIMLHYLVAAAIVGDGLIALLNQELIP
jgi:hypothetical protein